MPLQLTTQVILVWEKTLQFKKNTLLSAGHFKSFLSSLPQLLFLFSTHIPVMSTTNMNRQSSIGTLATHHYWVSDYEWYSTQLESSQQLLLPKSLNSCLVCILECSQFFLFDNWSYCTTLSNSNQHGMPLLDRGLRFTCATLSSWPQ